MSNSGGCLFVLNAHKQGSLLEDRIRAGRAFTRTVNSADWSVKSADLGLFLFSEPYVGERGVRAAGIIRKGRKVATAEVRVKCSSLVNFPGVTLETLANLMPSKFFLHLERVFQGGGGRIPSETWRRMLEGIVRVHPHLREEFARLERIRDNFTRTFSTPGAQIVAQEKDATFLALDLFGYRRRDTDLGEQLAEPSDVAPFLQNLSHVRLGEDALLAHDYGRFGDWSEITRYTVGAKAFRSEENIITIINANRTPIERTLGVDLVYYQHRYDSFVMVQYKRMNREGGEWRYRPTDDGYRQEVERMELFERRFGRSAIPAKPREYRLNEGPFYFKLCEDVVYVPASNDLIEGMYLPLDYWLLLLKSPQTRGPKGGLQVTYANASRHFNNTQFKKLVERGWIGSRNEQTGALGEIVGRAIAGDRSVILALSQPVRK